MIMFINNVEFSFSDFDMSNMMKGYGTVKSTHPQALAIANSLKIANTGDVTIQYANHGAIIFERVAGAWFKGIDMADLMGMVDLVGLQMQISSKASQSVYDPAAMEYEKGKIASHGGKLYVANKKMDVVPPAVAVGAFVPADWDAFDTHFKYAPEMPTADGKYVAAVKSGVTTWETASTGGGAGLAPADQAKLAHIEITQSINLDEAILEGDRASKADLVDVKPGPDVLKRFVDNQGLRSILQAMNAPREIYALVGQNPVMKMEIEKGGKTAQMQVIDTEGGHAVAAMEWLSATQEFVFSLYDKNSGVVKATFEIKPDGKAYISGKSVATEKFVTDHAAVAGAKGDTGAPGAKGADSTVAGPKGEKGDPGVAGAKGADSTLPIPPTADGDYKLNIKAGVATWVTV